MKCLVVGVDVDHETDMISIIEGVSPNTSVYWYDGYLNETVIEYARNNGYDAVVHGYTGEDLYFDLARLNTDIMLFMPSDEFYGDLQQLVLTGKLPTIETFEFADDSHSTKSGACAFVCGQLFKIAEDLNVSIQEARLRANYTKSLNGIINLNDAINYDGELKPNVGEINITYLGGTIVKLNLDQISDARIYEILITNHGLEINYLNELEIDFSDFEKRIVKYRGIFEHFISDWSEETTIFTLDKRRQLMGSKIYMFREGGVRRNEVEPDIPTEEGQIYVSEIVNGEMQMVKKEISSIKRELLFSEKLERIIYFKSAVLFEDTYVEIDEEHVNLLGTPTCSYISTGKYKISFPVSLEQSFKPSQKYMVGLDDTGPLYVEESKFNDSGNYVWLIECKNSSSVLTNPETMIHIIEIGLYA